MSIQTPDDNTFTRMPEFIDRDHRRNRTMAYAVDTDFMFNRHRIMLPRTLIEGKTVLDIGSCYGATGAWCLDNGATHYTGLEPQHKFVVDSKEMLGARYTAEQFDIVEDTIEKFTSDKKYDIIIASGVIYASYDPYQFINKVTKMANHSIIVETEHPFQAGKLLWKTPPPGFLRRRLREVNIIQIVDDRPIMIDADSDSNFWCTGVHISIQAITSIFRRNKWSHDNSSYLKAEREIPEKYDPEYTGGEGKRYMARFYPSGTSSPIFTDVYKNPEAPKSSWDDAKRDIQRDINDTWENRRGKK